MTTTPIDFTIIIGFRCTGKAVEFSFKLAKDFLSVRSLFEFLPVLEKYGGLPISYLMEDSFGELRNNYALSTKKRDPSCCFGDSI